MKSEGTHPDTVELFQFHFVSESLSLNALVDGDSFLFLLHFSLSFYM